MPFGDKSTLQSHFSGESFISAIDSDNFVEISEQVSDLIYQKTKVAPPDVPANAPGTLRFIWASIVKFKLIPFQKDISDEEKANRLKDFNYSTKLLDDIANGDFELIDNDGNPLVTTTTGDVTIVSNFGKRVNVIP